MEERQALEPRVLAAQDDPEEADRLVRDYLPFIKAEASKFCRRPVAEGRDDEGGVAMLACYEAVLAYRPGRGAFLKLAAAAIRSRLIDEYRREKRHRGHASLEEPGPDEGPALAERLAGGGDEAERIVQEAAAQGEIAQYTAALGSLGLTLGDVADDCPRQGRTLRACLRALAWARTEPEALEAAVRTGRLPLARMAREAGVERKTLERHRRYVLALLVAYTNGFELIRSHLRQLDGEGRQAG